MDPWDDELFFLDSDVDFANCHDTVVMLTDSWECDNPDGRYFPNSSSTYTPPQIPSSTEFTVKRLVYSHRTHSPSPTPGPSCSCLM